MSTWSMKILRERAHNIFLWKNMLLCYIMVGPMVFFPSNLALNTFQYYRTIAQTTTYLSFHIEWLLIVQSNMVVLYYMCTHISVLLWWSSHQKADVRLRRSSWGWVSVGRTEAGCYCYCTIAHGGRLLLLWGSLKRRHVRFKYPRRHHRCSLKWWQNLL